MRNIPDAEFRSIRALINDVLIRLDSQNSSVVPVIRKNLNSAYLMLVQGATLEDIKQAQTDLLITERALRLRDAPYLADSVYCVALSVQKLISN